MNVMNVKQGSYCETSAGGKNWAQHQLVHSMIFSDK